jgi:PAS domain S-box-containing protein
MLTLPSADSPPAPSSIDVEAARRLAAALAHAPAFICILVGPGHVFEYVNAQYLALVGGRDVIGLAVRDALPEIAGQGFFELLDEVYRTGRPFTGAAMPVRFGANASDAPRYLSFVYQALSGSAGDITGILVHGVDVTEMVVAKQSLETRSRLFDTVLSSIVDFAYVFDRDGRFRYVNKALLDLWGLDLAQAVGRDFTELGYPPELAARLQRQIMEVVETGGRVTDETSYTSPAGREGFYEYIFVPILASDGCTVESVAGSTRDISARKETERQLASARAHAEQLGHLKDEFLGTLSHELRTPLSAILGWTHVLAQRPSPDATVQKAIDAIARNARAQAQLIDDMLDLSRIEAGKGRLVVTRFDVCAVVAAAIESVVHAAAARQVEIRTDFPDHAVSVSGDADRIQQVVWNLVNNAVKFTGVGGAATVRVWHDGAAVHIEVADSGIGIRPAFLPYVFDRFRQEDSASRVGGGLGIGLAVVKQLTTLHGGTVHAASDGEGRGSTFTVVLPESQASLAYPATVPPVEPSVPPEPPASLSGITVLVVDDDADTRALASQFLGDLGATVFAAASVEQGLIDVVRRRPDVALCDIHMPGADGYQFLAQVRGNPASRALPVVAFSALARAEDRDRAMAAGFTRYLTKPIVPAELTHTVAVIAHGWRATPMSTTTTNGISPIG